LLVPSNEYIFKSFLLQDGVVLDSLEVVDQCSSNDLLIDGNVCGEMNVGAFLGEVEVELNFVSGVRSQRLGD
jgi:hypothetical protein